MTISNLEPKFVEDGEPFILQISNPRQGTRIISSPRELIEGQLALLHGYRNDGRVPSRQLLEDIAAYEAILQTSERLAIYVRARADGDMRRQRVIAKELGWIPNTPEKP